MSRFKTLKTHTYLFYVASSLLVFGLSAIVAIKHTSPSFEKSIFDFIYGWSDILKPFFWTITQLGGTWVLLAGIGIFYWQKKKNLALKLFIGGMLTYSTVQIAKVLIDRPRPYLLFSEVISRDSLVAGLGFPSGHTALITFFGIILQPYLHKRWRWTTWVVIVLVAISRIYLGVHAPLDVIGGFALGAIVAYTVRYLLQRRFHSHSA
ncbi:MAG TPA: phosphatase PAP2 family protein [Candidatus Saccharimonadales bacterium]|nr:phosphatase PAP2 family protein [Candidatus Saccharimonadales bacterium]